LSGVNTTTQQKGRLDRVGLLKNWYVSGLSHDRAWGLNRRTNTRVGTVEKQTHDDQNTSASDGCNDPQRDSSILKHGSSPPNVKTQQKKWQPTLVEEVAREQNADHKNE
jgi:hypothetical protein